MTLLEHAASEVYVMACVGTSVATGRQCNVSVACMHGGAFWEPAIVAGPLLSPSERL